MRAYHLDLRQRIVAAVADGLPVEQTAARFHVHRSTVFRYLAQHRERGTLVPHQHPGPAPAVAAADEAALVAQLQQHPTATLATHCDRWAATTGRRISPATMSRTIRRLGWTRKKGVWQPANAMPSGGLPGGTRR